MAANRKVAIATLAALSVVTAVGCCAVIVIFGPRSLMYQWEAQFQQLPNDDKALIAVIKGSERVIEHSVTVERVGSDGVIRVSYGIGGRLIGRHHPDLDQICANLGYQGQVRKFAPFPQRTPARD
jgi:hypothetical protein